MSAWNRLAGHLDRECEFDIGMQTHADLMRSDRTDRLTDDELVTIERHAGLGFHRRDNFGWGD